MSIWTLYSLSIYLKKKTKKKLNTNDDQVAFEISGSDIF